MKPSTDVDDSSSYEDVVEEFSKSDESDGDLSRMPSTQNRFYNSDNRIWRIL